MNNNRKVGERLKWVRDHLGLSGVEFGTRIGLSQSKIADLERGKTKLSLEVMSLLEREYGISRDWLTGGIGEWSKFISIENVIKKIEGYESVVSRMPVVVEEQGKRYLSGNANTSDDNATVRQVLQASQKFEENLGLLKLATKKAKALGLPLEVTRKIQTIIFGVETGDRDIVEKELNSLDEEESELLKNYRACSPQGKKALKCTSDALIERIPRSTCHKKELP